MAVSTDGDQAEGDGVPKPPSKAQVIRDYLEAKPKASNEEVAEALNQAGMKTTASYISDVRSRSKQKKTPKKKSGKKAASSKARAAASANYPRHSIQDALRVPRAILEQNAGKACTTDKAAEFVGVGNHGPFSVELSSATKYGFLERPSSGRVGITDLAKKILRPQQPTDEINGLREAFLNAPDFSDVYKHYRGENLPDAKFFDNALVDNFGIPATKLSEFKSLFTKSLDHAKLLEKHGDKTRLLDISHGIDDLVQSPDRVKKLGKTANISADDTCFVMMPFAAPLGDYYASIYEPAIRKAGLTAVRADTDIFGTGKIMDQIWRGINSAKVLVSELTTRNPNVFYELGLAHALNKPVILISRTEEDVPFDLQHIRVIYYDTNDPFWGDKLMGKVAENILSAMADPEEAMFRRVLDNDM